GGTAAPARLDGERVAQAKQPAVEPIRAQQVGEPQSGLGALTLARAGGVRGEEVLALGVQAGEPFGLLGARELRACLLGKGEKVVEVPLARLVELARLGQALMGILA